MHDDAYRLVVFDWEGTLADTLGQIIYTVLTEAKALGFGEGEFKVARQYVHLGLAGAVQKLFPGLTLAQQEQLFESVQQAMHTKSMEVCLIPGAKQLIEQLANAHIAMAVASNKGQSSLQRAIQSAGLHTAFAITRSASQAPPKPCTQMLQEIMDFCGVEPSKTLMIGDSPLDIEMANQLGVDAFGFDFYQQQRKTLLTAGALHVFDNYEQVAIFLQLKKDSSA